jgi:hypothetical protein
MSEQDNGGGFAPPTIEDVFGRRETAPEPKATGGQPEPQAPPPAPPETGDKPPAEQKQDRPRDDAGRFAPKQGEQQAGPPPEKHEPQNAPIAALKDERAKRQRAEAETTYLRQQLEALTRQPRPAPQAPPQQPQQQAPQDFWADPEAFVKGVREQAVNEAEERMFQTRLALSEAVARKEPDYEEAERALEAFAATSPDARAEVAKMLRTHPAPAMWALQAGRQLLAANRWTPVMQQHSDPEAYINAEVERRLQERMSAAAAPQPAPSAPPNLPVSLAGARNTAPRSGPGWAGPPSTQQLFGRRPR